MIFLLSEGRPCLCAQIDTINEAFVTARDEIEYAKEVITRIPKTMVLLMSGQLSL